MKSLAILSVIGVAALVNTASAKSTNKWEWDGEKDGITVFTRPASGSGVPMVKGVTTIDAEPSRVWDVITEGRVKAAGIKERKKVGGCGSSCEYIYFRIGNALIADRHYVVRMATEVKRVEDGQKYVRRWSKVEGRVPRGVKAEEIHSIRGSWIIEPLPGTGKTRITYINHLDLGGFVPDVFFGPKFVEKSYDILSKIRASV